MIEFSTENSSMSEHVTRLIKNHKLYTGFIEKFSIVRQTIDSFPFFQHKIINITEHTYQNIKHELRSIWLKHTLIIIAKVQNILINLTIYIKKQKGEEEEGNRNEEILPN